MADSFMPPEKVKKIKDNTAKFENFESEDVTQQPGKK